MRLPLQALGRNGAENGGAPAAPLARSERSALVIDDETEVGQVLSEMLAVLGIRCDVVASGEDGDRAAQREDI